MELTSDAVEKLFTACLCDQGEPVKGILHNAILDVTGKEDEIRALLEQLPDEFKTTKGGGWSFLNACNRADGVQWTGLHLQMEKLFLLGIAAGLAHWLLPRDMWSALPGGMPYVSVL